MTLPDSQRYPQQVTDAVKRAPALPGVYVMQDHEGHHLYVGKARNLRKRLASYFGHRALPNRVATMVLKVEKIELHVTHTEVEALLLESNLIKAHQPRYNIMLRDDKSYPYIRLSTDDEFPGLSFYRGSRNRPGQFFGPYSSAKAVRETLSQLQKIFPVRQCENTFFRNRSRPCLQYQIKRCTAPCVGLIDQENYAADVERVVLMLKGKNETLAEELNAAMEERAAALDYEGAAIIRDRLQAFRTVQAQQSVFGKSENADVLVAEVEDSLACVQVMTIRNGRSLGSRSFFYRPPLGEKGGAILTAFLPQYYLERKAPPEVILSPHIDASDASAISELLTMRADRSVVIKSRLRGNRKNWITLAVSNARTELERRLEGKELQSERLLSLTDALDLGEPPARIECFDISHGHGELTVASCVVFDASGPVPSQYRRFNIKSVTDGDDYAAMREVLQRRFRRISESAPTPDLILIDGGRGQLNVALGVLGEHQIGGVAVAAIAKGEQRKPGREKLFLSTTKRPTILPSTSPGLHLLQHIRDEAHRFAITGHRQRRRRSRRNSSLETIPGVGAKRRQALLKHFGGLKQIENAGFDELARVPGISPRLAKVIYERFHS